MSTFKQRLYTWSVVRNEKPTAEDPEILGGRAAEDFLQDLIGKHFNFKGASLYVGKRVPSRRLRRRREFDLIVCSPKMIHLIEVKNWSGSLRDEGDIWRQVRRGGDSKDHHNLITDNSEKRDVLIEYLSGSGVSISSTFRQQHICQKVVFMNPKLSMDISIAEHPDIITPRRLGGYLGKQRRSTLTERTACSIIEWCLDSETAAILQRGLFGNMPKSHFGTICSLIDGLGTWDKIHLFGSKIVTGDLLDLRVRGRVFTWSDLKEAAPIRLSWTRGMIVGLVKAVTDIGSLGSIKIGTERLPVTEDDTVFFHDAGNQTPTRRQLTTVEQIELG